MVRSRAMIRTATSSSFFGAAKVPTARVTIWREFSVENPETVHLREGHVGGGFGIRGELYPEDVLVAAAAVRFGLPVKWVEDRREHFIAANHSREQVHHVRAAVDQDGCVLAMEDEFFHSRAVMCERTLRASPN